MGVLITGGSGGVGSAIARRLAPERAVAVGYRDGRDRAEAVVADVETAGGEAVAVGGDVADPEAATAVVAEAAEALGGLDAVVNNAGVVRPNRLSDTDDEDWRTVLDTNLGGAFYVTRAAADELRGAGGDVVMVSSVGATAGTVDASYAASKAGLHGLTRALARELGPAGVQVNAVAPGPVDTPMNDAIVDYLEAEAFHGHENVDTHLPTYACEPAAVADSVAYLLDNEYVQGEVLRVNGGMDM